MQMVTHMVDTMLARSLHPMDSLITLLLSKLSTLHILLIKERVILTMPAVRSY